MNRPCLQNKYRANRRIVSQQQISLKACPWVGKGFCSFSWKILDYFYFAIIFFNALKFSSSSYDMFDGLIKNCFQVDVVHKNMAYRNKSVCSVHHLIGSLIIILQAYFNHVLPVPFYIKSTQNVSINCTICFMLSLQWQLKVITLIGGHFIFYVTMYIDIWNCCWHFCHLMKLHVLIFQRTSLYGFY